MGLVRRELNASPNHSTIKTEINLSGHASDFLTKPKPLTPPHFFQTMHKISSQNSVVRPQGLGQPVSPENGRLTPKPGPAKGSWTRQEQRMTSPFLTSGRQGAGGSIGAMKKSGTTKSRQHLKDRIVKKNVSLVTSLNESRRAVQTYDLHNMTTTNVRHSSMLSAYNSNNNTKVDITREEIGSPSASMIKDHTRLDSGLSTGWLGPKKGSVVVKSSTESMHLRHMLTSTDQGKSQSPYGRHARVESTTKLLSNFAPDEERLRGIEDHLNKLLATMGTLAPSELINSFVALHHTLLESFSELCGLLPRFKELYSAIAAKYTTAVEKAQGNASLINKLRAEVEEVSTVKGSLENRLKYFEKENQRLNEIQRAAKAVAMATIESLPSSAKAFGEERTAYVELARRHTDQNIEELAEENKALRDMLANQHNIMDKMKRKEKKFMVLLSALKKHGVDIETIYSEEVKPLFSGRGGPNDDGIKAVQTGEDYNAGAKVSGRFINSDTPSEENSKRSWRHEANAVPAPQSKVTKMPIWKEKLRLPLGRTLQGTSFAYNGEEDNDKGVVMSRSEGSVQRILGRGETDDHNQDFIEVTFSNERKELYESSGGEEKEQ
eukprot:TRINITY_DN4555_c0_g1_i3.p1 TRINITY_DN4555_c0_g1~~TRINITY_DN4555_c0_g1_i3.p1  ORF type:complete len:607 (-),score=125.20 TRINITY_DN4555_c0_g1_i3:188-2008(-)